MNCIYLKQKMNRTIYCNKKKEQITFKDCANCEYKEYKCTLKVNSVCKNDQKCENNNKKVRNNVIKRNRPSRRTQALAISKDTKMIVWERDNKRCIFCGIILPWNLANSHFIKRSHGGLGIPENVFCACLKCHQKFDDSKYRLDMLPIAERHMMMKYKDWNKDNLVYKK